jgi:uncharacterized zinc-type alcohol dehydrogenase-like protein
MIKTIGYAAPQPKALLVPYPFERRDPRPGDVAIDVLYCGVCHSDIHQARDEWGPGLFPMVPGHEIVGRVTRVGAAVSRYKEGDLVGVGCMVDSCRVCPSCQEGLEQYCDKGFVGTYNGLERDGKTPTLGGYSKQIVTDQDFVLRVSERLPPSQVAPLLCAGITTYSPLRHWNVRKGQKVGVVGLGGLGHMAVKFAHSFGARVVLFTTSPGKVEDAQRLGASEIVISKNRDEMKRHSGSFDFILDTVSAPHDLNAYLSLLKRQGTMTLVGMPDKELSIRASSLISRRRQIAGSLIGGIRETQEMLDYCADHGITSDVEVIAMDQINAAFERMIRSDVKYRFVIDMATLKT